MEGISFIVCCYFTTVFSFKLVRYLAFSDENIHVEKSVKGELKLEIILFV